MYTKIQSTYAYSSEITDYSLQDSDTKPKEMNMISTNIKKRENKIQPGKFCFLYWYGTITVFKD